MDVPAYVLIVALYTALGGQFDRKPHQFATFADLKSCQEAVARIEARSEFGWKFIAVCEPSA